MRQYDAPIVLGMISDKTNISRVRIAEIMPKYASPNTFTDSDQTPAAPIVCAMVLSVSIAATGLSTLVLYFIIRAAFLAPCLSFIDMNDIGVESTTASRTEHINETASAPKRYRNISVILFCISQNCRNIQYAPVINKREKQLIHPIPETHNTAPWRGLFSQPQRHWR